MKYVNTSHPSEPDYVQAFSKDRERFLRYQRKFFRQIVDDISWNQIPFYRKGRIINFLSRLAIFLPTLGIISAFVLFAIWIIGPVYYLKKFGMDELIIKQKRSIQLLNCFVVLILSVAFLLFLRWIKTQGAT